MQLQQTAAGTIVKKQFDLVLNDGAHNSTTLSRTVYASDYLPVPTVTSVTSPPMSGGLVTITGTAFGPVFPNLVDKRIAHRIQDVQQQLQRNCPVRLFRRSKADKGSHRDRAACTYGLGDRLHAGIPAA